MMTQKYKTVPPYKSLIEEIIGLLYHDGNEYSKNIIIFPNRRPAHFLRKEIARRIKKSFIPPFVYSIDDFVDNVYEMNKNDIKLETIDAVALLYEMQVKSSDPLGNNSFLEPDSFFPLGLKIYSDIEELLIEKIPVARVKGIDSFIEDIPPQTIGALQKLSYFYDRFYENLEKSGYSTRSFRYSKVSELINENQFRDFKRIILAGFFALTESEKDIFREVLSWDNSLLILREGPGISEKLAEIGIAFAPSANELPKPDIHFYRSPDAHGQIFGLSRLIKERLEKDLDFNERDVIVLPSSDSLFPVIRNCLSLLGENFYNISMGYPLHRTPIFGFLNNLMELVSSMNDEKVYLPDYLKFVLHPYTKNIQLNGKAEHTRIIFHTIEEELAQKKTIAFLSLLEIEKNQNLLNAITKKFQEIEEGISADMLSKHVKTIHKNTIGRFSSFVNLKDFADKCRELLLYIYNESTARHHTHFYPFSEAFLDSLQRLSHSLMKDISFSDTKGYFTFFRRYIMTCNTPFEGSPLKGLQVLGFLETRNLSFENVYMLDINEDIMPLTNKEKSLIPFAVRKNLGLPTYLDSDKISEYYFETLIRGARQVHIFFVENNGIEKSRFIEKILWQMQKKDLTFDNNKYIKQIQYKISLKNPIPANIPKTEKVINILKDFRYSASALDSYLKCGLKFYYNHILRLRKKDEITGDFEKMDIGSLVHDALRDYFTKRKNKILKKEDLNPAGMSNILKGLFVKYFGADAAGSAYLIQSQIKKHLSELINNYYHPLLPNNLKILECEYSIDISLNSFNLTGRLDCIEERDGKRVIIDYKTSSSSAYYDINFKKLDINDRRSWFEAIGSIQLPFYMLIYSESQKTKPSDLQAMFLLLGRNIIDRDIELPFFDETDIDIQRFEIMKTVILRLLEEMKDPYRDFTPPENLRQSCPLCDYKYICGTQWVMKQW